MTKALKTIGKFWANLLIKNQFATHPHLAPAAEGEARAHGGGGHPAQTLPPLSVRPSDILAKLAVKL
ncbi:hypothetical protein GGE09_003569 [Roseobacter sp. N2S]|nr:hypothetical protein [Roseobacter sp. N2S]